MFNRSLIFNNNISSWGVSYVTGMNSMFTGVEQYEQKICEWNLEGKMIVKMFMNTQCTKVECVDCPPLVTISSCLETQQSINRK